MGMQEKSASTEAFRARGGMTVRECPDGSLKVGNVDGYLSQPAAFAAEEYYLAKRDAEIGRWRWPENPDYVVYQQAGEQGVRVIHEPSGYVRDYLARRAAERLPNAIPAQAAVAYFKAHPERKPWHAAKYGEVWQVEHTGGQVDLCRVNAWEKFEQVSGTGVLVSMPITRESITAAVRVWPEDAS